MKKRNLFLKKSSETGVNHSRIIAPEEIRIAMVKKLNRNTALAQETRPVKILQFGEGNFFRAFVDWMVDILNEKTEFNAMLKLFNPLRKGMSKELNDQDGLFHVILKGVQQGEISSDIRLVKCVSKVINPYENYNNFLNAAKILTLNSLFQILQKPGIIFNPMDANPLVL